MIEAKSDPAKLVEQRKLVAGLVLQLLKQGRIKPSRRVYLNIEDHRKCRACAIGAAAYALLRNKDFKSSYAYEFTELLNIIAPVWGTSDMLALETAYQGAYTGEYPDHFQWFKYIERLQDTLPCSEIARYPLDARMRIIWENILESEDGVFDPSRVPSLDGVGGNIMSTFWFCARCPDRVDTEKTKSPISRQIGTSMLLENGVLVIGDLLYPHAIYCEICAPGVTVCRVCGCTDEAPCGGDGNDVNGVCWWTEFDLCSACVGSSIERAVIALMEQAPSVDNVDVVDKAVQQG